jgi:cytoskeletal protein RodZ
MLQAIEDGNVKDLAAPVLVRGFLKSYAQRIGLDPEEVITGYQDGIENLGAHQEAMEKFHQRLHPRAPRTKLFALVSVIVLLAALVLIWLNSSNTRRGSILSASKEVASPTKQIVSGGKLNHKLSAVLPEEAQSTPGSGTKRQTPSLTAERVADDSPEQEISKTENSVSSTDNFFQNIRQPSSASAPFELRAEAVETTWLRVVIDESQEREYTLKPGEQLTWTAASTIHLLVGNAGGIYLYVNNEPLKLLGESGKVVRLHLPDPSLVVSTGIGQSNSRNGQ